MTSAIDRRSSPVSVVPRGFTLIEMLVVIGILVLLAGILLPAVTRAWKQANRTRTQADLAAIATALEQYKADWGGYPPVQTPNGGAAALCKALLGPYDAAHYYTGTSGSYAVSDVLQNPPPAFSPTKVYQAGDVVQSGTSPTFGQFIGNNGAAQSSVYVCVRTDTQADQVVHTPAGTVNDFWWSLVLPYDGNDGPGAKQRMGALGDANDQPHMAAGKALGPYLNPDQFKTSTTTGPGMALLDRYGSPVLYFPVNKAAVPTKSRELMAYTTADYATGVSAPLFMIDGMNDLGPFIKGDAATAEPYTTALARIGVMLGDTNLNATIDSSAVPAERVAPTQPFLLWTAGPDRQFGPPGEARPDAAAWRRGDLVLGNAGASQNQQSADACDDVTNFRD